MCVALLIMQGIKWRSDALLLLKLFWLLLELHMRKEFDPLLKLHVSPPSMGTLQMLWLQMMP